MSEEIQLPDIEEVEENLAQGIELLKEINIDREYSADTFRFGDSIMETCSTCLSTDHIQAAVISNEIGLFHARQENFGYASFFLYSAIKFWQKNPDKICEDTVNTYIYLGIVHTLEPAFAMGREIFRNAHLALERTNLETSEKAAEVLCFEAELYMTQEDWDKALELLQQSLDMLAGLEIEKTHFKGECLLNIARIFRYQKKIRDALTYYQMAVNAYRDFYEKGHPIVAPVLEEWRICLNSAKEEKGSEILEIGSENN